jgi:hypothetical protein
VRGGLTRPLRDEGREQLREVGRLELGVLAIRRGRGLTRPRYDHTLYLLGICLECCWPGEKSWGGEEEPKRNPVQPVSDGQVQYIIPHSGDHIKKMIPAK